MPMTEHDSALMSKAAIAEGRARGLENLPVALAEPLPKDKRRYLYAVSSEHPLAEVYGASRLSAILVATQTGHLADRDTGTQGQRSARYGLRYCDRSQDLDPQLEPFVSPEAKRAWQSEMETRRRETRAVVDAASALRGVPDITAARIHLPDPSEESQDLQARIQNAISTPRSANSGRDDSSR